MSPEFKPVNTNLSPEAEVQARAVGLVKEMFPTLPVDEILAGEVSVEDALEPEEPLEKVVDITSTLSLKVIEAPDQMPAQILRLLAAENYDSVIAVITIMNPGLSRLEGPIERGPKIRK